MTWKDAKKEKPEKNKFVIGKGEGLGNHANSNIDIVMWDGEIWWIDGGTEMSCNCVEKWTYEPPDETVGEEHKIKEGQVEMLLTDNSSLRKAGTKLAMCAMHVISEFDGLHRLSLAVADWARVMGDEGGRGERYASKDGDEAL